VFVLFYSLVDTLLSTSILNVPCEKRCFKLVMIDSEETRAKALCKKVASSSKLSLPREIVKEKMNERSFVYENMSALDA
jgi:hypothetical protein